MSSHLDVNSVVKKLIEEYVIPPFPIYKVKYIHSYVDYDEENQLTLKSRVVSRLMECRNCTHNTSHTCIHGFCKVCIHNSSHYIFPIAIREFKENNIVEDYVDNTDHITLIDVQRVA